MMYSHNKVFTEPRIYPIAPLLQYTVAKVLLGLKNYGKKISSIEKSSMDKEKHRWEYFDQQKANYLYIVVLPLV